MVSCDGGYAFLHKPCEMQNREQVLWTCLMMVRQKMSQVPTVVGDVASGIGYVRLGAGYMWGISAPFQHCMNLELL